MIFGVVGTVIKWIILIIFPLQSIRFEYMKSVITIKDLARELNISPSTVSRALKDHPDISPETKVLVKELAEKMNYQPNLMAQGLRQSRSHTIGVIVPEFVHFFFSTVIAGIEDAASEKGYHVMMTRSQELLEREEKNLKALWNSRVDGVLVSISKQTTSYKHFEEMLDNGLPIVFFDRAPQELHCSHIVVDDHDGAFTAVDLLVKKGCRHIVHLAGPEALGIADDRLEGYIDCLKANDIAVNDELIVRCEEGGYEESYEISKKLIEDHPEIDGIFANHDMSAFGAMLALEEAGIEIPNQVKVVGFSDWQLSQVIKPNLTTISQPGYEMGRQAAEILIEEIESEKCLGIRKVLKTSMIERQST